MKEHHLSVLGLGDHATEDGIKAAYRKLSKKYHPDINPSPNAKEQFIKIKNAYEYLSNPPLEPAPEFVAYEAPDEREQWRQEYIRKSREKKQQEMRAQQAMLKKFMDYLKPVALAAFAFNILLTIDFLLPLRGHSQEIVSVRSVTYTTRGKGSGTFNENYSIVNFTDFTMRIPAYRPFWDSNTEITVEATRIFSIPMYAVFDTEKNQLRVRQVYNVYYVFGFLIPMILIMGTVMVLVHNFTTRLNVAVVIIIVELIQLYFYFI